MKEPMLEATRCSLLGYPTWSVSIQRLTAALGGSIAGSAPCRTLYCLNPHSIVTARRDAAYHGALRRADWLVPDGVGVLHAARLLCGRAAPRKRITGSDIFHALSDSLNSGGGARVFFLGSTEATLGLMAERSGREWPNLRLVGRVSPSFNERIPEEETAALLRVVNAGKPDVLWVGMTAPKQEKWIDENRERLECRVACGIGAAFDFYAGTFRRPGPAAQMLGLEWAVRLSRDPARLWRRTLVSAPRFAALVASEFARNLIRQAHE